MKINLILLLTAFLLSCDRNEEEIPNDIFEVATAGIGIDCKLLLIDFKEIDLDRIEKITHSKGLRYHAYNLDQAEFSADGQILTVRIRKTFDSELFVCTTLGPGYPWVTVLDAEPKE